MKAIDTVYGNYKYRSRTEARWAVFFDRMGVLFEYEKEGFDLDGLRYLPDFWLTQQKLWAEVKAEQPDDEEIQKAIRLAVHTNSPVAFLVFASKAHEAIEWSGGSFYLPGKPEREKYLGCWHECPKCHAPSILPFALCAGFHCWKCEWSLSAEEVEQKIDIGAEFTGTDRILDSYSSAMQSRFEHGENPGGKNDGKDDLPDMFGFRMGTRRPGESW